MYGHKAQIITERVVPLQGVSLMCGRMCARSEGGLLRQTVSTLQFSAATYPICKQRPDYIYVIPYCAVVCELFHHSFSELSCGNPFKTTGKRRAA